MSVWNAVQFCTFSIAEEAADLQSLLQLRKLIPKKNIPFSLLFVKSLKPDSLRQDLSKKEVAGERERERERDEECHGKGVATAHAPVKVLGNSIETALPSRVPSDLDHFLEGDSPVNEHQCRLRSLPNDMPRPSISVWCSVLRREFLTCTCICTVY